MNALSRLWFAVALCGAAAAVLFGALGLHARHAGASTAAAVPVPCVPPPAGNHLVTVSGSRVPVILHVPPGPSAPPRPLVLVLPGSGQDGRVVAAYTGYSKLADKKHFLVAYPTATGGARESWNVSGSQPGKPDDVAYLRKVIIALTGADGCADPARVGVTGVSNGGGMAAKLACDAADLLAAAAPVAGGYSSLPACHPLRPLPVLEIHSLDDEIVPYGGKGSSHAGSVLGFLKAWRARDRCTSVARRTAPARDVAELRWTCPAGRFVIHDRVSGAEHGWPGEASLRPFSSTVRTWAFLSAFRNELAKR